MCIGDEEGHGGTVSCGQDDGIVGGRRRWAKLGWLGLKSGGGFLAWVHPVHDSHNGARQQMVKNAAFEVSDLHCG
jgi:hypothetical protein